MTGAFEGGIRVRIDHRFTAEGTPIAPSALLSRAIDLVVACAALVLLSPVLMAVAVAVKATSRGPILFSHERAGRHGRPFRVLKFRSMRVNQEIPAELKAELEERFKLTGDPRITSVGRILRRTSLDELPQLLNVLAGDMAIVGPRPVTRVEVDRKYGEHAAEVLSVKPGLTGLWQVSGRSLLSYEDRVRLDVEYVRTRSIRGDLGIMLRTIPAILSMRGAE